MTEQRASALGATAYVVTARALRASARIVIVFLLARFYSEIEVATFAYSFVAASLIGVAFDLGLTDFAVREIATAKAPHNVTISVLRLRAVTIPIAVAASVATIVATSSTAPVEALAISAYATMLSVSDLLGAIHRARGRYPLDAFEAAVPVIALVSATVCAVLDTSSLVFFGSLGIVATICVSLRVTVAARRAIASQTDSHVSSLKLFRDGRWFAVRAVVTLALFEIAVVLLQQLAATTETALYAVAQRPVGLLNQSLAVIAFVFLPTLSRTYSKEPERLGAVAKDVNLIYLLLVPAGFAACMLGGDAFLAISGDVYASDNHLVLVLAIATLLYSGTLTTAPLLAAHHERIVVASSVVGVALLAAVGIAIVPTHGAEGAAIATAVAAGGCKLVHITGYRLAKLPLGDRRHLAAMLGAAAFIAVTTFAGRAYYPLLISGGVISAAVTARVLSRTRLASATSM